MENEYEIDWSKIEDRDLVQELESRDYLVIDPILAWPYPVEFKTLDLAKDYLVLNRSGIEDEYNRKQTKPEVVYED